MSQKRAPGRQRGFVVRAPAATKAEVKEVVEETLREMGPQVEIPLEDQEFNPDPVQEYNPFLADRQDRQEAIIDQLLAGTPQNQGWYLKLYKEVTPNQWEFKHRIDDFHGWSDLEWEVTKLVRAYTEKSPFKWGSARYRILKGNDMGFRGPEPVPIYFMIDALETTTGQHGIGGPANMAESVREQLAGVADLLSTVQKINPSIPPHEVQKQAQDMFMAGMQARVQDGASSAQSMNGMFLVMAEMIKSISNRPAVDPAATLMPLLVELIRNKDGPKEDVVATMAKMRAAGLIPDHAPQGNPADQLKNTLDMVNSLIPLAERMGGGGGEEASGWVEALRVLGPQLSEIVSGISTAVSKTAEAKIVQASVAGSGRVPLAPLQGEGQAPRLPDQVAPGGDGMVGFLKNLRIAVQRKDVNFFPEVLKMLRMVTTQENLAGIIQGTIPQEAVTRQLVSVGGAYFASPASSEYFNAFINWARREAATTQAPGTTPSVGAVDEFEIECPHCQEINVYDAEQDYKIDPICMACKEDMSQPVQESVATEGPGSDEAMPLEPQASERQGALLTGPVRTPVTPIGTARGSGMKKKSVNQKQR